MEKKGLTIRVVAVILAVVGGSARAVDPNTHIWIDQATGRNAPDVTGSCEDPFKSVTFALGRADFLGWAEPWHVHIGPGVYDADPLKPASEREIFPIELRQDMIFEGGDISDCNSRTADPNTRIIDGQHLTLGLTSILLGQDRTGLEIRNLTLRNMNHSQGNGGAVELINCAGKIENCIIKNNRAGVSSGGGVWLSPRSGGARFDFVSCSFSSNTAPNGSGGGFYVSGSLTGNITECSFSRNTAGNYGGGFRVNGSLTGNITDCSFVENSGGGLYDSFYINTVSERKIERCQFFPRPGGYSVGLQNNSDRQATIRNCLFVAPADPEAMENVSGWAINTNQKTKISNNTIVGPGLGGPGVPYKPSAIYIVFNTWAEQGEIFNNIIVDSQCAIAVDAAVDMPIEYNCFNNVNEIVCQGEQGVGNECWWLEWTLSNFRQNLCNVDPVFITNDPMHHIGETSPCINTGDPNYVVDWPGDETDIDGQPRIDIDRVDIGADEYYAYTLIGDISKDGIVNFVDFAVLGSYWQQGEPLADISPAGGDGIVDFLDLGVLVDEWLQTEPWY